MPEQKLSVLIFSRNDIDSVLGLIGHIYDIADEIILVDSSIREKHKIILDEKLKKKLSKLKVFYAIALGYPDMLRTWALKKCRYRWVLLIDTDERLSARLKKDIKRIIQDRRYAAFGIKRYEEVRSNQVNAFFTWQVRLFDKNKIEYKGVPHDQPMIDGKTHKLPEEYWMEHQLEFKNYKRSYDYSHIEKFERYSYKTYNRMMLEYFGRATLPEGKNVEDTGFGRLLSGILNAYEKITLRDPEGELSNFDYFAYYVIKNLAFAVKRRDLRAVLDLIPYGSIYVGRVNQWKKEEGGREFFEILKVIYDVGIIKFLDLDKEETIKRLNLKYKDGEQGIDLLILLLREKYRSTMAAK